MSRVLASLAAMLSAPVWMVSFAQPIQRISERSGAAPEGFSRPTSLQELPDGRVVVADPVDRSLYVVDLVGGRSVQLGGLGSGPREYDAVGPLLLGPGDTIWMPGFGSRRLHLILPSGELADVRRLESAPGDTARGERKPDGATRVVGGARYADATGRLYHEVTYLDLSRRGSFPEAWILGVDPGTGSARAVAPLRRWYPERSTRWRAPFTTQDVWVASRDGRVARVVPSPYHVEWYRNGEAIAIGPIVEYRPVPVLQVDRDAWWAARATQPRGSASASSPAAGGGTSSATPPRTSGANPIGESDFPKVKPPFVEEFAGLTAWASPEGEVWVARTGAAGDSVSVLDVFDARGHRVRQVMLPPGLRLLALGKGVAYTLRTDEDGLQWLERYRR